MDQGWAGAHHGGAKGAWREDGHRGHSWCCNGRATRWGTGMGEGSTGERKVGEVQLEVSGVNEIFSSGGPRRIAEIAEAEMINI